MTHSDLIYVAGHSGLVGSAVVRKLRAEGYRNILTATHNELDLIQQQEVVDFFKANDPKYVFLCAGKVGGIMANDTQRADFIYQNLMMQANVIHAAYDIGVEKLIAIGSSCIYPRECEQPIKEDYFLTGKLEPTNEPYAVSKIAAIKMCEAYRSQYECNFISAMPTNLYGQGDNYKGDTSHVIAAMIKKFHEAKANNADHVVVWGTGVPRREFMHVDDLADALLFLMLNYNDAGIINVGTGVDISIQELAHLIKNIVGYKGEILNQVSKPDGMKRKLLDVSKINAMGWTAKIGLREGIEKVYKHYIQ